MATSGAMNRLASFKNMGKTGEELRKKRNDVSVELRKKGRDDQLSKRRNIKIEDDDSLAASPLQNDAQSSQMSMEEIVSAIRGLDADRQYLATRALRQMLSKEKNPPIQKVVETGLVPDLVKFLSSAYALTRDPHNPADSPSLQFEAAWALTNIASGSSDDTLAVVRARAVPYFVALLKSKELAVCEQAVWALGNIAGDGPDQRDEVLRTGAMQPLIALVTPDKTDGFLRNVAWTISNLCRNKNPPADFAHVRKCLPTLSALLGHQDSEIVSDVCWALSYISDGTNDKIQAVADEGIIPKLVLILNREDQSLIPCLRTLGNIVTGTDLQTQTVIDCGVLAKLEPLLRSPKPFIQKEASWMISNIAAGTQTQIQAILNLNLVPAVLHVLKNGEFKAQKEAAWAITNLTSGGSMEQIASVANHGVLKILCQLLDCRDAKVHLVLLDGISNILATGKVIDQLEHVCNEIEECGGLDKIERLQGSPNDQVYRAALDIIEKYFSDDDDDENVEPAIKPEVFQFNADVNANIKYNF